MSNHNPTTSPRPLSQKLLLGALLIICLSVGGYWGNKTVQTYLGQSAVDATGLNPMLLPEALAAAKSSNKLVLADMSAIWCPTCRRLDKEIFANEEVKAELEKNYVFARIEYESPAGEDFRRSYDVEGFPTLLILDENAKKLIQLPLEFDPKKFIENIQKVSQAVN
ncbi:thioredoxin family protein [Paraglaciecola sp. 2405UD69-4]|uniref:thioredoxin family protein n=1 Tax=Paraglaciecola sp. 2405UD69-4 TaxID=3391836 RepID=UPI0039C8DD21